MNLGTELVLAATGRTEPECPVNEDSPKEV